MAQIPRSLPATAPTNVTSGRLQGGPRSVASADASPIEETRTQTGVLFNDALLFQDDDTAHSRERGNSQGNNNLVEYAGSSQTFASIFQEGNSTGSAGNVQTVRSKGFANLVTRAINIYETNVQVIHGTTEPRGTTLSMTL